MRVCGYVSKVRVLRRLDEVWEMAEGFAAGARQAKIDREAERQTERQTAQPHMR